jgi:hypothetical protein
MLLRDWNLTLCPTGFSAKPPTPTAPLSNPFGPGFIAGPSAGPAAGPAAGSGGLEEAGGFGAAPAPSVKAQSGPPQTSGATHIHNLCTRCCQLSRNWWSLHPARCSITPEAKCVA